jgi:hypothetical protein
MPSSTSSSEKASRARVPWALLAALLLFTASERAFWRSDHLLTVAHRYTPRGDDGDPLVTDAALRLLPPGPLVTLLGSSQVREGLDCAAFEAALPGQACRSLAVSGGTPLDALYIQGRLGDRPRTTVLALFPKLFHIAPKAPFVDLAGVRAAAGMRGPWRLGGSTWGSLGFGLLQQASPTLRYKDAAWALWREVRSDPRAAWRLVQPPVPERLLARAERQPDRYFANRVGVLDQDTRLGPITRLQHAALDRFLTREHEAGRTPIVVDFPTHPDYPTTLAADVRDDYAALLARLAVRDDIRFVPRTALPALGSEDFLDFMHLGPHGRARVSEALARVVQDTPQLR